MCVPLCVHRVNRVIFTVATDIAATVTAILLLPVLLLLLPVLLLLLLLAALRHSEAVLLVARFSDTVTASARLPYLLQEALPALLHLQVLVVICNDGWPRPYFSCLLSFSRVCET